MTDTTTQSTSTQSTTATQNESAKANISATTQQTNQSTTDYLTTNPSNTKSSSLSVEGELERLSAAFKLNPFEVLDLPTTATATDINRQFRFLSLRVHPDKVSVEQRSVAQQAFNWLQTAKVELLDADKKSDLMSVVEKGRQELQRQRELELFKRRKMLNGLSLSTAQLAPITVPAANTPEFEYALRVLIKESLIDREWRRRQLLKAAAKAEAKAAKEKEERERLRKEEMEQQQKFEETREDRVNSWRSFQQQQQLKNKTRKRKAADIPEL